MKDRTPEADPYFLYLVRTGRECPHPPEFRGPLPFTEGMPFEAKRLDPFEWECGVCFTAQVRREAAP